MTVHDINTGAVIAWPTAAEQVRQGGRHRWDKGGPVDTVGRRIITNPVSRDYNPLPGVVRTNLAPHHWANPDRHLPAPEGELTGRMDTTAVLAERAPEQPDRAQVLAEMREQLGDPAAAVADIFTTAGCPPIDTTTKDPA
ncbi:hypothetical protein [Micromonospora tarensis]|uniref:Uncharacterized protein n=1 Tax=Micromonospora tarensis TaxID=2806100 RepID=A0ABS1Y9Q5_9ACTN|nr:hypothetical protein [Micromonospora tarensis]MBM0274112.1 hypothetical protein [Micromonospora tarensis]